MLFPNPFPFPPMPLGSLSLLGSPLPTRHEGQSQLTCLTVEEGSWFRMSLSGGLKVALLFEDGVSGSPRAFFELVELTVPLEMVKFQPVVYEVRNIVILWIRVGELESILGHGSRPEPVISRAT